MTMRTFARRLPVALLTAVLFALLLAPVSEARQVGRKSDSAVLPYVSFSGDLRKGERVARVSARSAADVRLEAVVNIGCVNLKTGAGKTRVRTFTGTGRVGGKVRRPRVKGQTCFASTIVRATRGTPGKPVTLRVALYAQRG